MPSRFFQREREKTAIKNRLFCLFTSLTIDRSVYIVNDMARIAKTGPMVAELSVRDRLLDTADRLFYHEGVRAVGIDRVLAGAGAAKASLYQHFGGKDQLVASCLERRTMDGRARVEAYLADTPPSQRALRFFDWVVLWAKSEDFRGCPLQHTLSELTDAAHPARGVALAQRAWFTERFVEWTTAAGVEDAKATARALMVLFDGALAGSEVDGPQRASDARWIARKLLGA